MEPGTTALVQSESWACCLPSHNTVTTGEEAPKHREQSRAHSLFFALPGCPHRAARCLSVGLAAQHEDCALLCSLATSVLPRPLSSSLFYCSSSTKFSLQPADVLPSLLRMLSISCRPAGDFPAAGSLGDPCCTPAFPSLHLSSAAQRLLTELELVFQMASPCGKRLFRPRKGRRPSSSFASFL